MKDTLMKTFKAKVKMPIGNLVDVQIQASDYSSAMQLLEAQYGAGNVIGVEEVS